MRPLVLIVTRHPVATVAVWSALILLGLVALILLPVEMHPELEIPQVRIVTEFPGMPAGDVEQLITVPLEQGIASVAGIRSVESVTRHGMSALRVGFDWGIALRDVSVRIRERVDAVYPLLPQGASRPLVFGERLNEAPVMIVAVSPKMGRDLETVMPLIENELVAALRQRDAIGSVTLLGAREPQIHVDVDPERLASIGMSITDVADAVAVSVYQHSAGSLLNGETEQPVQVSTSVGSIAQIGEISLRSEVSGPTISELARVSLGQRRRTSFFLTQQGESAVALLVFKDPAAGTLSAARATRALLQQIQPRLSSSLAIDIVHDDSIALRQAIRYLLVSIALGMAAATLVLRRLLQARALVAISVCSIPVSVLAVFVVQYSIGLTLNLMSLTGIAIGTGMIIDNSIVVLERIARSATAVPDSPLCAHDIADRLADIGGPMIGSTVTTLLVFVPVLFIRGVVGALFTELALMIVSLLLAAHLCALTLTPALAVLLPHGLNGLSAFSANYGRQRYQRLLRSAMRSPRFVMALFGLALIAGGVTALLLPRSVLPAAAVQQIRVRLLLKPGTAIEQTERTTAAAMQHLSRQLSLASIYAYGGFEAGAIEYYSEPGIGSHFAEIVLTAPSSHALGMPQVEQKLAALRDGHVDYRVAAEQSALETLLAGPPGPPRLRISGSNRNAVNSAAATLAGRAAAAHAGAPPLIEGLQSIVQYRLQLDTDAAAASGVTARSVIDQLRSELDGISSGRLNLAGRDYDILVRRDPERSAARDELGNIIFVSAAGSVAAASLLDIQTDVAVWELRRANGQPMVEISFADGSPTAHAAAGQMLAEDRADSITVEQLSLSRLQQAAGDVQRVFGMALILMLLLLTAQFESLRTALLLLALLPAALLASSAALLLTGHSLNLNSAVGMLIMLGTTLNAGIILSSAYRDRSVCSIVAATSTRLLPIMATTLTTIAALAPAALDPRPAAAAQAGMATAVIGGLLGGTATTLIVYPVMFSLPATQRNSRRKR